MKNFDQIFAFKKALMVWDVEFAFSLNLGSAESWPQKLYLSNSILLNIRLKSWASKIGVQKLKYRFFSLPDVQLIMQIFSF